MQLVSLVGNRTIGQEEEKTFTELKLVSLTGTRIIRIPVRKNDNGDKKEAIAQEQAPPVHRNVFFRFRHQ